MGKLVFAGSSGEWGWHATEVALTCPRLFAFKYLQTQPLADGEQEEMGPALLRGSLVHAGLAQHYMRIKERQQGGDPTVWASAKEGIAAVARRIKGGDLHIDAVAKIVDAYAANWMHERLEILGVEEVYETTIHGHRYTQRLDLVVRETDGKVYAYDHKTTGRIDAKVLARYNMSGQFMGMAHLMRERWGAEYGGRRLNLIEIGTSELAFRRELVDAMPGPQRAFPLTVLHARTVVDAYRGSPPEEWPRVLSEKTCVHSYGRCDMYEQCRWGTP